MNLDEEEKGIYNQLDSKQRGELDAMTKSTEFWNRLPKMAALAIAVFVFAVIIT